MTPRELLILLAGGSALLGITVVVLGLYQVPKGCTATRAVARAAVQLAFIALVLRGAISSHWGSAAVVGIMFTVAATTAYRRIAFFDRALRAAVLGCAAGSITAIGIVVGAGIPTRDLRTLIAVAGINIGGCMTAVTLTGRHLADAMTHCRDEIEGWLAIGATPVMALRDIARRAASEALIPGQDQTRTVGLVSLPGAFVGALLAGADTASAAQFQFIVLTGLICAQSITAVVTAMILTSTPHLTLPQPDC